MLRKILFLLCALLVLGVALAVASQGLWRDVDVVSPARGDAVKAVYATGTVEPTVMMPVTTRVSARLVQLNVDEGSKVSKGDVLAQLDDADVQNSIQQLRAKESRARQDYDRNLILHQQKVVSQQGLDQARADLDAAAAATREAEVEASYLRLAAPADGEVIRRDGEIGQMITPSDTVFWLAAMAPLRITADVDEEDVIHVKPDMPVLIRADAMPQAVYHGRVLAITPKGDPVARTYRVRVAFLGETPLKIGMTAETNIILEERKDALLVPNTALRDGVVWVVSGGRLVETKVVIGIKGAQQTEILSGLSDMDVVVRQAASGFKNGMAVRVREQSVVVPPTETARP